MCLVPPADGTAGTAEAGEHLEEQPDAARPDAANQPDDGAREAEAAEQQQEGGEEEVAEAEDAALDEASLPSTLFYGVRGQQVRLGHIPCPCTPPHHCPAWPLQGWRLL